jgi:hypothetical protein
MELAFAALHQLCAPVLEHFDQLPHPQRGAIGMALGLSRGVPADQFLLGLAVLNLLADTAEVQPLVWVIDDAQWLDRASKQVLAFVARRLMAGPIGLVFAVCDPYPERELLGLPVPSVRGIPDNDGRLLLDSMVRSPFDEQVRDRIIAESGGNPLAILVANHGAALIFALEPIAGLWRCPLRTESVLNASTTGEHKTEPAALPEVASENTERFGEAHDPSGR